jgi:transcriptional regulator with XRE-family HTH domain
MGRRHEPQPALGRVVRRLRKERDLTQAQVARAMDVDSSVISHLELGHSNPAWGSMKRLAAALGVTVAAIATEAEEIERTEAAAARRRARRTKRASSSSGSDQPA